MSHKNVEIKARSTNHDFIRTFLLSHHADFKGIDHQIDTYFAVNNGRLKLREGTIENDLIFYERNDVQWLKQSNIILFQTQPNSSLKEILSKSVGELVVVDKTREIYFIDTIKFHIDTVKNLGTFVEIEARDPYWDLGIDKLQEQCNYYMNQLKIESNDLISWSYSDLLMEQQS